MTSRRHCPTCRHAHDVGPAGRLVCGGDDAQCRCDPAEPCRCSACLAKTPPSDDQKPSVEQVTAALLSVHARQAFELTLYQELIRE